MSNAGTELKLMDKPLHREMTVTAVDDPGPGGANHEYQIQCRGEHGSTITVLKFQKGPVNEVGANGISDEALLTILIHRLNGFQHGPFASREGLIALTNMQQAHHWLRERYEDRNQRGVEGYNKN
jgi:hypothetical protein